MQREISMHNTRNETSNISIIASWYWNNIIKRIAIFNTIATGAMLMGGAYGATANETNPVPPPAPGIHQTVNQGYHTLKHLDHGFKFPKKDFDWYKKLLDTNFRKLYPGIENDKLAYDFMVDRLANNAVEYGGSLKKGTFNMKIDAYNNYATLASHIDSLNIEGEFKTTLKEYYATRIIKKGDTVDDTGKEKERLSMIPSDSVIVSVYEGDKLGDIVTKVYPNYRNIKPMQQKKVLDYITEINPLVRAGSLVLNDSGIANLVGDGHVSTQIVINKENKKVGYRYFIDVGTKIAIPTQTELKKLLK